MKANRAALIVAGAVVLMAQPALAIGPPTGVPMGPPAFAMGPPPGVALGPPANVPVGPPPAALAHIPSGVPLGKPDDPSAIGTTVRESARANRAAIDHANAKAFENANTNAGLVQEETTTVQ